MRRIYCFVENETEVLEKLIVSYDGDSEIHIYSSIIESCESELFFCFGHMLSLFWESEEKSFLVTDVKEIFLIAEKLYSTLFEKICFIDQGVEQSFKKKLDDSELLDFSCKILQTSKEKDLMETILRVANTADLVSMYGISNDIYDIVKSEDWRIRAYWAYLGKLLLMMKEGGEMAVSEEYKLFLLSLIMKLEYRAENTNQYLEYIIKSSRCQENQYYFIWNQFKNIRLRNFAAINKTTERMLDEIYAESYRRYLKKNRDKIQKIYAKEREKNKVLVLTIQYLGDGHAPTRTVMERCKALKKMGKEVYLINTAEQYTAKGYVPLYDAMGGTVCSEYTQLQEVNLGDEKIWFRQLSERLSMEERLDILVDWIRKIKPYYILSIGSGSILADLCGNMIPCASMALAFSTFPHTVNCMKILGRGLHQDELDKKEFKNVIESRFTFELKPQRKHFTRRQYHLPDDKFILVIVGIRLDYEITSDFCDMLDTVCRNGCYVVFAGIYDTYEKKQKENPFLAEHSTFIGYCDDIPALMEICDLYVNPKRLGGGFSVIEAFAKGVPGVYLSIGDVNVAGGKEFSVNDFDEMTQMIEKYKNDREFYRLMSDKARKRARLMTSSLEAMRDLDGKIMGKLEKEFW